MVYLRDETGAQKTNKKQQEQQGIVWINTVLKMFTKAQKGDLENVKPVRILGRWYIILGVYLGEYMQKLALYNMTNVYCILIRYRY